MPRKGLRPTHWIKRKRPSPPDPPEQHVPFKLWQRVDLLVAPAALAIFESPLDSIFLCDGGLAYVAAIDFIGCSMPRQTCVWCSVMRAGLDLYPASDVHMWN